MPAPNARQSLEMPELKIVGGANFGRYPKISTENTYNMIVSDDALVDYAGYRAAIPLSPNAEGRGIYSSIPGGIMIVVLGQQVFSVTSGLVATFRGSLATQTGDVFISENNNAQIAITDEANLYVYNWHTQTFLTSNIDFMPASFPIQSPGYISFQNGLLIIADIGTQNWYLSGYNDAIVWSTASNSVGALQSKPDKIQAAVPTPGGGNNIVIFGHNVIEQWQFTAAALFPYQRASTFNVDYGCLNASSIAALDNFIVWLAANEQSGPTLMFFSGNKAQKISTDGIDYKLATLSNPTNCTGFLFRQDGHLIYQFTFPDDNLSYAYDFNTKLFSTVTDENLNYHIARNVVFFQGDYYFVSLKGGNVYRFGTQYPYLDYGSDNIQQMPRIRVVPPLRLSNQRMFIIKSLGFTIENGQPNTITAQTIYTQTGESIDTEGLSDIVTEGGSILTTEGEQTASATYYTASEAVDLSISRDGGETFGSSLRLEMNPVGKRKSRFIFQRLGQANDVTFQLRFNGFSRYVVFDGEVEVYQ